MCRPGHTEVVPPALPPEVDLVAWRRSTDRLLALAASGAVPDALRPPSPIRRRTSNASGGGSMIGAPGSRPRSRRWPGVTDDSRAAAFAAAALEDLGRRSTPEDAAAHALAAPFALYWAGLARYLRKA